MGTLDAYVQDVMQNSRSRFMALHNLPFLLHKKEPLQAAQASVGTFEDSDSKTRVAIATGKTGTIAILGRNAHLYAVYALRRKMEQEPYAPVSIGRHASNDVVITETAVSKVHAIFTPTESDGMYLEDAGSRNGTIIGGRKLRVGERYRVDFGDSVLLGGLALTLIGSGALWEVVQSQMGSFDKTIDYIEKK